MIQPSKSRKRRLHSASALVLLLTVQCLAGCYAPLHSPGIRASSLPDEYRVPAKTLSPELNYAMLTRRVPPHYLLGPGDFVRVEIADLTPVQRLPPPDPAVEMRAVNAFSHVAETQLTPQGDVLLPLVGAVRIKQLSLTDAQSKIASAYADGFIKNPKVAVTLAREGATRVMVIGGVARPNLYELPKYKDDIAHALTVAGGIVEEGVVQIERHRRVALDAPTGNLPPLPPGAGESEVHQQWRYDVLRIPLRCPPMIAPEEAQLQDGDVVIVRSCPEEVFFVVGKLSPTSFVRFTVGREDRDLGNGFVLPPDRDVDVVTAVAMAGYIDPIDSPTTVTVHRTRPDGSPLLIHVDLIAARYDRRENIMVQAGDIIYLNPDSAWWFRRTFDRVIPVLITSPYTAAMDRLINPNGGR